MFWVQDRINVGQWSEEKLLEEVGNVMEKLSGGHKKSVQIMNNDVFDPLYSILFYLDHVSVTVRKELIQSLNMGLKSLVSFMDKMKVLEWANENLITATSAMSLKDDPIFKIAAQI